ncbi:MAG: imidazole glycerol phosphate synthase subunit HisF [Candidatus Micrarchaeia archaeon]|jgi:cyclase
MLAKRIIPCLDVRREGVVKGVNFKGLARAGDPVELASRYCEEGADELVFLDIAATIESRKSLFSVVEKVSQNVFVPLTVGGGVRSLGDFSRALSCGADKVSVNSAAITNPKLVSDAAAEYGSQCVVVAIDAKKSPNGRWSVFSRAGTQNTGMDAVKWAKRVEELGAGEILLTSIDRDGTNKGFDVELTRSVSQAVGIPVIASGGAGCARDFCEVFSKGKADAALAAGIFHFGKCSIGEVKRYLSEKNVCVRV